MTVSYRAPAVLLLCLCLVACSSSKKIAKEKYRLLDTVVVSASNNPMEIYRATSPRMWEIVHTGARLRFDFKQKEAQGAVTLQVRPYAIAADTLVLDAKGMVINTVGVKEGPSGKLRQLPYSYDSSRLKIVVKGLDFGSLSTPKQQAVYIDYVAKPYATEAGGSRAITEDRGLYFINTDHAIPGKPVQIWTQGETESNSHWLPTIDKPNQRTMIDLSLVVPDTMQTLSNGRLMSTSRDSGMRQDDWRMDQPIQVYAIMFAIGRFEVAKDSFKDAAGNVKEVNYYTEPAFASTARGMFKNTPEMMAYFSRATGVSYPWNKYSQVVVRDYVSGAMENTSASLFGEFMNQNARQLPDATSEDVVSHELFHQWFGDYVTAESWSNLTLNESFATYGEQLWRRHKYGAASAEELAFEDLQKYLNVTDRADPSLVRFYYRDKEEMFDRVSYQKGGSILHYINSIVGDTAFNRAMEIYLHRNALQAAEASQWRLALEEATGQDWTQFFNQWYYHGGHPVLRVHYAYDDAAGMLKVTVRQNGSPDSAVKYTLPLKADIITGDVQRTEDWLISERVQTFSYAYKNGVRPVIIPDAMHAVPGIIIEDKSLAEWLVQLTSSDHYTSKRMAVNAAMSALTNPISLRILEQGLNDKLAGIRAHTLNLLARVSRQAWRDSLRPGVAYLLQTDGSNKVRAAALTVLGTWKVNSELPAFMTAVSDSSYLVAGSALNALREVAADSAYTIAERLMTTDPKGPLQDAVWYAIVTKGNPADMARFEAKAPDVYGTVKVTLAHNLRQYALAVKDDTLYERTLKLILQLVRTENIRGYRYAIGSDIFALREIYKSKTGKRSKDVDAAARVQITERYTTQILAEEQDAGNLKQYKNIGDNDEL